MKKLYFLFATLFISSILFGQQTAIKKFEKAKLQVVSKNANPLANLKPFHPNDKAPGDIIWSEDFTGGMPAGWTTGGVDGANWVINSVAISATFTNTGPIASTSGGNHMLFFAETINPVADRDAYFQTDAIAINGELNVTVQFQQKFRLCCAGNAQLNLVVSTDSTFTTNVDTFNARGATVINDQSADPEIKRINITSIAGGLVGNIYLRFHWASGASHYYWMVDDIMVVETDDNDLVGSNPIFATNGIPYYQIPLNQVAPIDFSINAKNIGAVAQTNSILTVDVNSGFFTGTSNPITILPNSTEQFISNAIYTPLVGSNIITMSISSDSIDVNPVDNSFIFNPIQVNVFNQGCSWIYAVDQDGINGVIDNGGDNNNSPGAYEFEAGNFFDIYINDQLEGISVFIGINTPQNTVIDVVLYEYDSITGFLEVERSNFYIISPADNGNFVTFPFNSPSLSPGKRYFAAVHTFTEFYYGTSGTSINQNSLIYYPNMTTPNTGEAYFTTETPMIRILLSAICFNISELNKSLNFSVSPNPSKGIFNLNLETNTPKNVNISVKNMLGQTILKKALEVNGILNKSISLADYNKGIYYLTVTTINKQKTVKLVLE
jgi:Secretion system C-terminal sorting domain